MPIEDLIPQPTESEAIVAALQADPASVAALAPPVPLPVDVAAGLPAELRHPERQPKGQDEIVQRRKDDAVGGEGG